MKTLLEVKDGSFLSINDIHKLQENGSSILRSAHVGNLDSQTLFLAKEGFPIILDEYAIGYMRVYRPAYKIQNKIEKLLSKTDDSPSTHLSYNSKKSVATYHYENLVKTFPNSIKLTSEHVLKEKEKVLKSLQILSIKRPESFARFIDIDGEIYKYVKHDQKNIYFSNDLSNSKTVELEKIPNMVISGLEYTKSILNGNQEKAIPIITLDVDTDVSLITLSDINWNKNESNIKAIHFSGLEMINYMVKNEKEAHLHVFSMNEVINLIIHLWTKEIPEKIEMMIVPTDIFPYFICDNKDKLNILNQLYETNLKISELSNKKNELWKQNRDNITKNIVSLSDNDLISLVKNIKPNNAPEAFIKTLSSVKDSFNKNIKVERKLLNQIAINHLLYASLDSTGINKFNTEILIEEEKMKIVNQVKNASFTQYDSCEIYFPNFAYNFSIDELRSFYKKVKKYEN